MKNNKIKQLMIYQSKSGQIEFRGVFEHKTVWGNQKQLFGNSRQCKSW